jgi:hypothetical protein
MAGDHLSHAVAVLHALACIVTLAFAFVRRRSAERQDAFALALVWCAWLALDLTSDIVVAALPPPGDAPLSGVVNRVLLALDGALYFAWPLGFLAWIRWTFVRANPLPSLLGWLLAFGIPTALYPAIRGVSWFRLAGLVHVAVFAIEAAAIWQWAKLRERPRPWHSVAIASTLLCSAPIFAFFALSENRHDYSVWVLRALVALHLGTIAFVGGDLWGRSTSNSPR